MIPIQPETPLTDAPVTTRDIQHYMRPGTLQLASLPPLSLYVHLPWCLKKCPYCDFNSHEMRAAELPEQRYIDALMADLEKGYTMAEERQNHGTKPGQVQSGEQAMATNAADDVTFF